MVANKEKKDTHSRSGSVSSSHAPQWEVRLSFWQLFTAWAVIAGGMVGVFFFGLIAGQEGGLKQALEDQAKQIVRLPVEPLSEDVEHGIDEADLGLGGNFEGEKLDLATLHKSQPNNATPEKKGESPAEVFDFRENRVSPPKTLRERAGTLDTKTEKVESAGFAAKSVAEAQKGDLTQTSRAKLADVETKKNEQAKIDSAPVTSNQAALELKKENVAHLEKLTDNLLDKTPKEQSQPIGSQVTKKTSSADTAPKLQTTAGWYIQLSAEQTREKAQVSVKRLSQSGFNAQVQDAKVKNAHYFRVLVGPYRERKAAESALIKIKQLALSKGEPFLKRVQ